MLEREGAAIILLTQVNVNRESLMGHSVVGGDPGNILRASIKSE